VNGTWSNRSYFRLLAPRMRLRPDLRSCFLRALRFSEARSRAVVFCAMIVTSWVAPRSHYADGVFSDHELSGERSNPAGRGS